MTLVQIKGVMGLSDPRRREILGTNADGCLGELVMTSLPKVCKIEMCSSIQSNNVVYARLWT